MVRKKASTSRRVAGPKCGDIVEVIAIKSATGIEEEDIVKCK
jgi:hypothetical protein